MNEFDKILKQKLESYTETPPAEVFENISKHFPKRTAADFFSAYKYHLIAALAAIGIVTAVVIAYLPSNEETTSINPDKQLTENTTPDAPDTKVSEPMTYTKSSAADANSQEQIFEAKSSAPTPQSENRIDALNLNDTTICGNELLIEGSDVAKIKASDGLVLTKVASGVKISSKSYGTHALSLANGKSVKITFAEAEKLVASVAKTDLCYGEKLLVNTSEASSVRWNDAYYSVAKLNDGKYELSGLNTGKNSIVITTGEGRCTSKVMFDVNVANKLNYSISTKANYCSGKNGELTVKSDSKINYCRINGSDISCDGTFSGLGAGIYMVEINYANSCITYDTVLVRDKTNLNAFFESTKDAFNERAYTFRNYTRLDDSGNTQNVDFEWLVNGAVISSDYNFEYEFKSSGKYEVELIARIGDCESRYSETIGVTSSDFRIPNVFTPNGDGIGDEFTIKYNGTLLDYDLSIYTKAGQLVFHSQQIDNCWNGKISGNNDASEGVYFYVITATGEDNEKLSQKGTVQLIRR
ncbi:MAG: gliding motility-associated C-terminal domain-containing protein [Bacteroidales bacterium]|nr:gliding motility-associated C-terminal domain-containing protein [Bacteroidales bacterium]